MPEKTIFTKVKQGWMELFVITGQKKRKILCGEHTLIKKSKISKWRPAHSLASGKVLNIFNITRKTKLVGNLLDQAKTCTKILVLSLIL